MTSIFLRTDLLTSGFVRFLMWFKLTVWIITHIYICLFVIRLVFVCVYGGGIILLMYVRVYNLVNVCPCLIPVAVSLHYMSKSVSHYVSRRVLSKPFTASHAHEFHVYKSRGLMIINVVFEDITCLLKVLCRSPESSMVC